MVMVVMMAGRGKDANKHGEWHRGTARDGQISIATYRTVRGRLSCEKQPQRESI